MSSCSRSGIWCTGVAVVTSSPKNAEQGQQDDGDDRRRRRRSAVCRRPSRAGHRSPGRRPAGSASWPTTCAMPGTAATIESQPMNSRPRASGLGGRRSSRSAGEEQHDRQHHDQRADDPADALGDDRADGADPVAPGGGAEHDRQAEHGEADAVPAVFGGSGSASSGTGDRAGQPSGAAGSRFQPRRRSRRGRSDCFFFAAGPVGGRFAAGRFLLAAVEPERPREEAGRRVDVVRAGMRRTVIASGARSVRQTRVSRSSSRLAGPPPFRHIR